MQAPTETLQCAVSKTKRSQFFPLLFPSNSPPMSVRPVLIAGQWRDSQSSGTFQAANPATGETLAPEFPVSSWEDCDAALDAAAAAAVELRSLPTEKIAAFLERFAERIERRADDLVEAANRETGLPPEPRLAKVELPRTTGQLRQAAAAAREGSWATATIDTANGIRSLFSGIGPVAVFGPNNFPFAFGSLSGGDFAAAIAAGTPVIGKANSSHPETTRIFAEEAHAAALDHNLPEATVQLLYRTSHADGERLVADPRLGAIGYTGSRTAGLKLKTAADAVGTPIYLELSSVNPVAILPGALAERGEELATEFVGSCLMGAGQFCTNPGLVLLVEGAASREFIDRVAHGFDAAPAGTLLSAGVQSSLAAGISTLESAGAKRLTTDARPDRGGCCHANTLLEVSGEQFLADPAVFQTEAFGNESLFVVASSTRQLKDILSHLEGNLTGCIYSDSNGADDEDYNLLAPVLRTKVGRLLNDKMPTGVAVSPAMNHGGPFPATGHPGFTAVGIPASIARFAQLQCFDNVRPHRLPALLQDTNPSGAWRWIDGQWTKEDVS